MHIREWSESSGQAVLGGKGMNFVLGRKRSIWLVVGFIAATLVVPILQAQERGPNIILLVADDQRWDTLGITGNPVIQTPQLDRLGREGVVFDHMFVTTSICATSRASIFTGQYARRHGVWDFSTELSVSQLNETYLGVLKQAGYRIGFVGKWGVGNPPAGILDFDRAFPGQGNYWFQDGPRRRHLTEWMGDQAVQFLVGASEDSRPFCLSVSFKAPHVQDSYDLSQNPFPYGPETAALYRDDSIEAPRTAAPDFFERLPTIIQDSENRMRWAVRFWGPSRYQESVKGYYRLISGIDNVVGRIRESLQQLDLDRNTVILFTGDNGFFLGESGLAGKWLPHEPSIRVPLLVYDPRAGTGASGRRIDELVLNIDLAPTIVQLAGQAIPKRMQGKSLLALIQGEAGGWRNEFFYEHLFEHPRIPRSEGVRTQRWKYFRYIDTDPLIEELYDLKTDPFEEHNLAGDPDFADDLHEMRAAWKRLRSTVMEPAD